MTIQLMECEHSKRLLEVLNGEKKNRPTFIYIDGPQGVGKTSSIHLIEEECKKNGGSFTMAYERTARWMKYPYSKIKQVVHNLFDDVPEMTSFVFHDINTVVNLLDESTCPPIIRQVFITIDLIEHLESIFSDNKRTWSPLDVVVVERGLPGAAVYTKLFLKRQSLTSDSNYATAIQRLTQTEEYQAYMNAIDMGFLFICDYVVGKERITVRNRLMDQLYIKEDFILDAYAAYNFEFKYCMDNKPYPSRLIDNTNLSLEEVYELILKDIKRIMNM